MGERPGAAGERAGELPSARVAAALERGEAVEEIDVRGAVRSGHDELVPGRPAARGDRDREGRAVRVRRGAELAGERTADVPGAGRRAGEEALEERERVGEDVVDERVRVGAGELGLRPLRRRSRVDQGPERVLSREDAPEPVGGKQAPRCLLSR